MKFDKKSCYGFTRKNKTVYLGKYIKDQSYFPPQYQNQIGKWFMNQGKKEMFMYDPISNIKFKKMPCKTVRKKSTWF